MKKYFILFCVPVKVMAEWTSSTAPEEQKKMGDQMMQDWGAWQEKHKDAIKDKGLPLGKTKRVTKGNVTDVKNDLNYYIIVEAESHDAAAEMIKDNPHLLMIPESYVEVMEVSQMGM